MKSLTVSSPCFENGGLIPIEHTGYGEDNSPKLILDGLSKDAVSIAIIMNDMQHPISKYNYWVIWNIPVMNIIPGTISPGEKVKELGNAVQGRGYGKNRYKGPKPPFGWSHRYDFNVYALDCILDLPTSARKKDLLKSMQGHILQEGVLSGHYR